MEVNLTEICYPKQWKTISISNLKEDGYPVYGANGLIGYYDKYTHENQTIMITCRGATCGTINLSQPFSYINGNAMALDNLDTTRVDINFLYYYLRARGLNDVISGSAQPQITRTNLVNLKVPLPPLVEQKKIAEILRKSQELIIKRNNSIKKHVEFEAALFNSMFGNPIKNEKQWATDRLGNYIENIYSGWSPNCENRPASKGEWGILKLSAVTKGFYNPLENKAYISNSQKKLKRVQKGDILLTRKNTKQLVGACAYVFNTPENLATPDIIFTLNMSDENPMLDKIYLYKLFNNQVFKKVVQNLATGAAGSMPNISKKKLMNLEIVLPPIEHQHRFRSIIEKNHEQKKRLETSLIELKRNYDSLLQHAFGKKTTGDNLYEL